MRLIGTIGGGVASESGWGRFFFRAFCQNKKSDSYRLEQARPLKSNLQQPVPGDGPSFVAVVELELLGGPLPSATAPSVPGALRMSLEVIEDIPVTAQPAQLEELPAG